MKKIPKSTNAIYLATDDESLIYDDRDDTYIVISLRDALKQILKGVITTALYRTTELGGLRLQENGYLRLLETSPRSNIQSISKRSGTLKNISKS